MASVKDFRAVNPQYDQDWVNGVGESEYQALFKFLEGKHISSILDLAGGSGALTRMLIDRGYDAFLFDIADNMVTEGRYHGIPDEKSIVGDVFTHDFGRTFDCVILKSSMHEIPLEKSAQLHSIVHELLNAGGWFVDWDVHVPTNEDATFLKQWVNVKDAIAGLSDLVKNRHIYTETFIAESMEQAGFKNIEIPYRFLYTVSVAKMSRMYWSDDPLKTKEFFEKTREMEKKISPNIIAVERAPMDIEFKIPAIIIGGQK